MSEQDGTREASGGGQYLTFKLREETYAVGILKVKEILRYEALTRVPSTPASIRGVMNLRGAVIPVIDLAAKFGLPPAEITKFSCVVIVEVDLEGSPSVMGIMADAVSAVIELRAEDISPAPSFGTGIDVGYLVGMGNLGGKLLLILDIDRAISASELQAAEAAARLAAAPAITEGKARRRRGKRDTGGQAGPGEHSEEASGSPEAGRDVTPAGR